MKLQSLSARLISYGLVGIVCAGVYATVLIVLERLIPIWLANPLAFLFASLIGSLGHSKYTFQNETGGNTFARRWVVAQYLINIVVCSILPLLLAKSLGSSTRLLILVFTPTILNALIWSQAARFSARRLLNRGLPPRIHADDLGLSGATNQAILQLAAEGKLDGASLLVNGVSSKEGARDWKGLERENPHLELCLHLCLTEGPSSAAQEIIPDLINKQGYLKLSFGQWLLLSVLPPVFPFKRRIRRQLKEEVKAQIHQYRNLTGKQQIHLDGHQHIHLVPIVLGCILDEAGQSEITWIRSTREPFPAGLPLKYWWQAWHHAGHLKWFILQILSLNAIHPLRRNHISTNSRFAGVLFTGKMTNKPLLACWRELTCFRNNSRASPSILLAHPGGSLAIDLHAAGFHVSHQFAASEWRQKEWNALNSFNPNHIFP